MKEQLKELGLENDVLSKVEGIVKDHINGRYIPKERFDEVNQSKKEFQAKVEELSQSQGSVEEFKTKYEELQKEYEAKEQEYQNKLKETNTMSALKLALNDKVHDIDIVAKLIDRDNLKIDDNGNIEGLDDVIKPLQENKPFLFKQEQQTQEPIRKLGVDGTKKPESPEPTYRDALKERMGLK